MRKVQSKSYQYIENLSLRENEKQLKARENSQKLGLDAISLSTVEADILKFLISGIDAKKIVEIGTLTGLSALYILQTVRAEAKLWTLEKSPEHAKMAEEVLADYIQKNQCEVVLGDARESLEKIASEGPFGAVFIDGNKTAYLDYFNWAVEHIKVGGLIIADNVFLAGAVWGDQTQQKFNEKQIRAVQEMNQKAFSDKNLQSVIIPTEEGMLVCKKLS